jgi:hypothetical protein
VQLDEYSLLAPSEDENRSCECARDREDGIYIPGAPAESVPRETNDANDHIGNEHAGQSKEDVVYKRLGQLKITVHTPYLSRDPTLRNLGTIPSRAEANAEVTLQ